MPLEHGKSKKAFEHNVKAEVHAGKPVKQAVAIAYSEKREAMHGHKHYESHEHREHERRKEHESHVKHMNKEHEKTMKHDHEHLK